MLKWLVVKHFDHFPDLNFFIDEDVDPLIGKSLLGLKGQKWKDMRATLSPAFTGTKMRQMFELIRQVGVQSTESLKSKINRNGEDFEMKDFMSKFTVDVIATCAFGVEVNSFEHPNNEFQKISKTIFNFEGFSNGLKIGGYFLFPNLMKLLKIRFMNKRVGDYFQRTIINVMKEREAKGIVRHDMINLLMEARRGKLDYTEEDKSLDGFATVEESEIGKSKNQREWTDEELAAQAFTFFLAGYESEFCMN